MKILIVKIFTWSFAMTFSILIAIECSDNPISSNGESCTEQNGDTSSSKRWLKFNISNSCLLSNSIHCLEIDKNKNLWIGTDEGLVFYDGTKWIIYNKSNSKIPENVILSITSEQNIIWLGMKNNIVKFDGKNWAIYNSNNSPIKNAGDHGQIDPVITSLKVDTRQQLWAGTNYYGLYKFDNTNWYVYYPNYNTPISSPSIRSIDIDSQDIVWIGHAEPAGVDRFDGITWINYSPENSSLPSWYVNCVHVDKNDNIWFGTNFGLAEFDGEIWNIYDNTNSNILDEIFSITSDSKNNLWIGTFSGTLLARKQNNWIAFYLNDISEPEIPYNTITCVITDQSDNKWIGTYKGLFKFNENGL